METWRRSLFLVALFILICGIACRSARPIRGGTAATRSLVVRNHEQVFANLRVSDTRADAILADATQIIQGIDANRDVACPLTLNRVLLPVGDFATPGFALNATVSSAADQAAVFAAPGNVKIVNDIRFCETFNIGIISCGELPGDSFFVEREIFTKEGILWLHEFGHNQGLQHRGGEDAVMNPTLLRRRRVVDSTECTAFTR